VNHYEELGLGCGATTEQIRSAYRNLARLLHPDQQQDEELRRLAEVQMKRLNFIHDVLTDPVRRSQYDASLLPASFVADAGPPGRLGRKLPFAWRDAGLLAAGVALGSLFWLLPEKPSNTAPAPALAGTAAGQPVPAAQRPTEARPQESARVPAELSEARRRLEALRGERDAALAAMAGSGAPAVEPAYAPPIRAVEPLSLPPPNVVAVAPPPASISPAPSERGSNFGGTWVYVRPRISSSQQSMYLAEYVEAVIVEQSGILRGRYRARYSVPDRPISAEVAFRFEGRHNPGIAEVPWTGPGGAKGDLKLRLISRDKVELSWIATDLGSQMGLASGTAVLTRRQEP
jgi:curved DNA-binding protein CbpA